METTSSCERWYGNHPHTLCVCHFLVVILAIRERSVPGIVSSHWTMCSCPKFRANPNVRSCCPQHLDIRFPQFLSTSAQYFFSWLNLEFHTCFNQSTVNGSDRGWGRWFPEDMLDNQNCIWGLQWQKTPEAALTGSHSSTEVLFSVLGLGTAPRADSYLP